MKPFVALSYELIDMELAAEELVEELDRDALQQNSLGVVFCDSELDDAGALVRQLHARLGFDVVGCTTQATINRDDGIGEMCTCLLVLTADDCRFHAALTAPLTHANYREEIAVTYRELHGRLEEEAKMILTFPPHNYDITIDYYPQVLSELSGNLPVFGGIPGYNAPYGTNAVLLNDGAYTERMLLVLLEGNVRPVFSVAAEMSHQSSVTRTITESEENIIYSIDNMSVPEYLSSIGIDPVQLADDNTDILFVSNPLKLTLPGVPEEEYMLIRTFQALDLEKGTGTSLGLVPKGHNISIGSLTRKDIRKSATRSINELVAKIEESEARDPSYRYTTVLCVSCAGRYMVLSPKTEETGGVFKENIPPHLTFAGYYAYGEFVPTAVKDGVATNTAQNESLTLCAF